MRIVLHIGRAKTGTGSIQESLAASADALADDGVLYPLAGRQHASHQPLGWALEQVVRPDRSADARAQIERIVDDVLAEVATVSPHTVVFSTEVLSHCDEVAPLLEAFERIDGGVEVVAMVRRQDSYLESMYAQLLRTGRIAEDPDAFLRRVLPTGYLDHLPVVGVWGEAVGWKRTTVVPYEPDVTAVDSVDRFASVVGISTNLVRLPLRNERVSRRALEVLRLMPPERRGRQVFRSLLTALAEWAPADAEPAGWEHFWTHEERIALLSRFAESNRMLAVRVGLEGPLFRGEPQPAAEEFPGLHADELVDLVRQVWEADLADDERSQVSSAGWDDSEEYAFDRPGRRFPWSR